MSKRTELAIEVLKNGGYFRNALERNYHGHEKFVTRLYTSNGRVVKGVGFQTRSELEGKGMLQRRPCPISSTWPQEWELVQRVAA